MYVAAWPLLEELPGARTSRAGCSAPGCSPSTTGRSRKDHYSDIEGGLGWWRDTRFATETPKFIMGGVALNFSEWANGPGAGKGRDWKNPTGPLRRRPTQPVGAVAARRPEPEAGHVRRAVRVRLPAAAAHRRPRRRPPGRMCRPANQCWTLFLNTGNFKGPVAFFTPYFWSKPSVENPKLAGRFLDARRPSRTRPFRWRRNMSRRWSPPTAEGPRMPESRRRTFQGEPTMSRR